MHGCVQVRAWAAAPIADRKRTSPFACISSVCLLLSWFFYLLMSGRSAAAALDARSPPQTTHAYVYLRLIDSVFRVGNPILDYQPISSFLRHFRFVRFLLPTPYRVISYYTTNGLCPSPAESASVTRSKSHRHPKTKHIQRQQRTHRPWWPCQRRQGAIGSWLLASSAL